MISASFHSFALFEGDIASTTEEELYLQCKDTYTAGKFGDAIQHIEKFLSLYSEGDHAGEILFMQAFLQPDIDTSMEMHRAIIEK
jgi:outer membrane protein assembly factor BamD (BamD/ComL family)